MTQSSDSARSSTSSGDFLHDMNSSSLSGNASFVGDNDVLLKTNTQHPSILLKIKDSLLTQNPPDEEDILRLIEEKNKSGHPLTLEEKIIFDKRWNLYLNSFDLKKRLERALREAIEKIRQSLFQKLKELPIDQRTNSLDSSNITTQLRSLAQLNYSKFPELKDLEKQIRALRKIQLEAVIDPVVFIQPTSRFFSTSSGYNDDTIDYGKDKLLMQKPLSRKDLLRNLQTFKLLTKEEKETFDKRWDFYLDSFRLKKNLEKILQERTEKVRQELLQSPEELSNNQSYKKSEIETQLKLLEQLRALRKIQLEAIVDPLVFIEKNDDSWARVKIDIEKILEQIKDARVKIEAQHKPVQVQDAPAQNDWKDFFKSRVSSFRAQAQKAKERLLQIGLSSPRGSSDPANHTTSEHSSDDDSSISHHDDEPEDLKKERLVHDEAGHFEKHEEEESGPRTDFFLGH